MNQGQNQNDGFKTIINNVNSSQTLNPIQMIPGKKNTSSLKLYNYTGSLTTPPCTPPVIWVVLADPIQITKTEYGHYTTMNSGAYAKTNRTLQATLPGTVVNSNF